MNSRWSNVKLEGPNDDEILQFFYPWKANKIRNPRKLESKRFKLKIREKSMFQNQQKSEPNLGKNEEQNDF